MCTIQVLKITNKVAIESYFTPDQQLYTISLEKDQYLVRSRDKYLGQYIFEQYGNNGNNLLRRFPLHERIVRQLVNKYGAIVETISF